MENVGIVLDWMPPLLLTQYRLLALQDIYNLGDIVQKFAFSFAYSSVRLGCCFFQTVGVDVVPAPRS